MNGHLSPELMTGARNTLQTKIFIIIIIIIAITIKTTTLFVP